MKQDMKQENRKWYYLGAAVLCIALIIIFLFVFMKKERSVSVFEVLGNAFVQKSRAADEVSAFEGMRIEEGDVVSTGEKSSLTMLVDEDKLVRLDENSTAAFAEIVSANGQESTVIDLRAGTLVNDLQEKLNDNITYEITTPNATISVRGTYFTVYVGSEEGYAGLVTKVNVYAGTVAVEHSNGEISILRGEELQGADYILEWENGVELPKGNRAIVGDKVINLYKGVDFSGLILPDLDRLEELTREGKTDLTLEEIEEQRVILQNGGAMPEQEPETETEEAESTTAAGAEEIQTESSEPVIAVVPVSDRAQQEPDSRNEDKNKNKSEGTGTDAIQDGTAAGAETPAEPETDSAAEPETETETIPVQPDTDQSQSGGSNSSGSGGSGGGSDGSVSDNDPGGGSGSILDQEMADYKPVQVVIQNKTELEEDIADLQAKKDMLKSISGDTVTMRAVQGRIDNATAALNTAQAKVDAVNACLDKINAMRYPSQIEASDAVSIQAARTAYDSLTALQKPYVPAASLKKLEKCEAALAALTP